MKLYCKIGHEVNANGRQGQSQSRQSAKPFLQSYELGLPHPLTRSVVPFRGGGGRAHSLAGEEGGGVPSDEGTGTLVLYVLCDDSRFFKSRIVSYRIIIY